MQCIQFEEIFPSLRIVAVAPQPNRQIFRNDQHAHPFYEFGMVLTGQCDWWLSRRKRLRLNSGEGLLLPPGQVHFEEKTTPEPTQLAWVGFSSRVGDSLFSVRGLKTNQKISFGHYVPEIRVVMERVQRELRSTWTDRDVRIRLALGDLLVLIRRCQDFPSLITQGAHEKMERGSHAAALDAAAAYLEYNSEAALRIGQLARYYSLSLSHFTMLFRKRFGCTPKTYLLRSRMKRVEQLMQEGAQSVKEMATSCGFVDSAHFCKWFKGVTGRSPLQFAREKYGLEAK